MQLAPWPRSSTLTRVSSKMRLPLRPMSEHQ